MPSDDPIRSPVLLPVHVVQGVHEAQIRKLQVPSSLLLVRVLDVQVGDVVREYGDLVRMYLVHILVLQPIRRQALYQASHEGACACRRIQDLHVLIREAPPEVPSQEVVHASDDEINDLVGRIHHPQPVRRGRVVGSIEILVDRLQEPLLLCVIRDLVCGPPDSSIVRLEARNCLPARVSREERSLQLIQLPSNVVLAVELILSEHAQEDVLRQDVLEQHLSHVLFRNRWADALSAQIQELCRRALIRCAVRLCLLDRFPQVPDYPRQIHLELPLRRPKLPDLRQFVVQEPPNQPMEVARSRHVYSHGDLAVLNQHRSL